MIYITGDTHGLIDFDKLNYFKTIYTSTKDILIILGDAGIVWSEEELQQTISKYELLGMEIVFIDGNHENFSMLNNLSIVEMYGAKMHKISNNIYHVLRGEIMTINNLNFLCLGGAISIDKHYRILNKSYWLEEEITEKDINNALTNLKKYNFEVDYVLTHCVDTITLINEFGYNPDACTDKLNFIDKFVKYKYWYFGHYHIDKVFNNKRCFYNDILTIKEVYSGNKNKNIIRNVYFEEKIKPV
jgi:DNA repair exonuclease SbcCD nuclease subunit